MLLGNQRFSWREIAGPSSLLKKRFLYSLLRRRLCGWLLYLFSSQIRDWSSCGFIFFTERGLGRREGKNEVGRDACLNPSLVDFQEKRESTDPVNELRCYRNGREKTEATRPEPEENSEEGRKRNEMPA